MQPTARYGADSNFGDCDQRASHRVHQVQRTCSGVDYRKRRQGSLPHLASDRNKSRQSVFPFPDGSHCSAWGRQKPVEACFIDSLLKSATHLHSVPRKWVFNSHFPTNVILLCGPQRKRPHCVVFGDEVLHIQHVTVAVSRLATSSL